MKLLFQEIIILNGCVAQPFGEITRIDVYKLKSNRLVKSSKTAASRHNVFKMSKLCSVLFIIFAQISFAQTASDSTVSFGSVKKDASEKISFTTNSVAGKFKQILPKRNKKAKNVSDSGCVLSDSATLSDTAKLATQPTDEKLKTGITPSKVKDQMPQLGLNDKFSGAKNTLGVNNDSITKDTTSNKTLTNNIGDKAKVALPKLGLKDKFSGAKNTLGVNNDSASNDTTKTTTKLAGVASQSSVAQPLKDRFQSLPVSKDSLLKGNAKTVLKNNFETPHFDLKEKADLKGKTEGVKNNLNNKKESLFSKVKTDSLKPKAVAFVKKQVKEFNPKGNIGVGYEYGILPSVMGPYPTGGYRAEGQVGFNALGLPLIATFHYTNIKNAVGINNYFRISYDANQYKEQLAQKLNVKDQLTQVMLANLQKQQQQLVQQMDYSNMLSQSYDYQNTMNGFNTNGITNNINTNGITNFGSNYNMNGLSSITDTSGMISGITQYGNTGQYTNGLNQYSNFNDSSALNKLAGMQGDSDYLRKKDSITNVISVNKAKYDSINKMITDAQQQVNQIQNLKNNTDKLSNPYLSKVQNFMSHIKKLEIGLCNPNYSTFLVNNIPLQGINVEYEKNNNFVAVTYGTTMNNLLFNTNTLQGSLQGARNLYNYFDFGNLSAGRKILAVKAGVGAKDQSHVYVGFLAGKGKTDYTSDSTVGSIESNLVMELDAKYVFTEQLSLDVVLGKSSVKDEDLTMEQIKKSVNEIFSNHRSNAFLTKLNIGIKKTNTKLTLSTRWIDPYFKSFGLSFMRSDNLRYEIKAEQPITKRIKYTVAYRREEDNLLRLLSHKTTLQSINNSLSIKFKKGFSVRLNYVPLFRQFKTADFVITDKNHIATAIVTYVPKFKKVVAQFNALYSRYIITGDSANINFENYTYTHQFQFKSGFKTGLSCTLFKDNLKDSLNNNTFLSVMDIGYAAENGNSLSVGGKMACKKQNKPQYGFIVKGSVKVYKGLFFEAEAEKIIIGDYYNPEMIEQIQNFPFYFNTKLTYNF